MRLVIPSVNIILEFKLLFHSRLPLFFFSFIYFICSIRINKENIRKSFVRPKLLDIRYSYNWSERQWSLHRIGFPSTMIVQWTSILKAVTKCAYVNLYLLCTYRDSSQTEWDHKLLIVITWRFLFGFGQKCHLKLNRIQLMQLTLLFDKPTLRWSGFVVLSVFYRLQDDLSQKNEPFTF